MLKQQLILFFSALRFFTRIPVPAWVGHSDEQLNQSTRYFPLVGLLVGIIAASVTILTDVVLPMPLAIMAGMLSSVLVTGAFHEDGLADAVDGFGGGYTKERMLDIMKDSRIGSYGAIALVFMLLFKFSALREIAHLYGMYVLCPVLVGAHVLSRLAVCGLIARLDYVRDADSSKVKPMGKQMTRGELAIAAVTGLIPLVALWFIVPFHRVYALALFLMVLATVLAGRYFRKHLGGYTGDCLGATQQVSEAAFYLGLLCSFS